MDNAVKIEVPELTKEEKHYLKNMLKYREYTPPVIHLEFLSEDDFNVAWQLVEAFEGAGVAFAVLTQTGKKELTLSTYGIMTDTETLEMYRELRLMDAYKGYSIVLD